MRRISKLTVISGMVFIGALPGCANVRVSEPPEPRPAEVTSQTQVSFQDWLSGFRTVALAQGISVSLFDTAFEGVTPDPEVLERNAYQPEFRRQIWEYLDRAVSERRIVNGQAELREHGALLRAIEQQYGVDRQVVLAIWGLESSYGAAMGRRNVIRSLATLAHEGSRRSFAEAQLIGALKIVQAGHVSLERMRGSWAGAMGHTQFIPTSFLQYAQDWTGDGRRDIWADDPSDALASTANYLKQFGWRKGLPWGVEVKLPAGFDLTQAGGESWRNGAEWAKLGVERLDGGDLAWLGNVALISPAGARGPVFAITRNFRVIRRYNNATSYALAVGHLGDRIMGGAAFRTLWPRGEPALSVAETEELQRLLTLAGFDTQGADGVIGPNSVAAIRNYQRAQGLTPDGFPTRALLERLQGGG